MFLTFSVVRSTYEKLNSTKDETVKISVVSDGLPFDHGGAQFRAFNHTKGLRDKVGVEAILVAWNRSAEHAKVDSLPDYVHPVVLCFQNHGGTQNLLQFIKFLLHIGELCIRLGYLMFSLRHKFNILHVINAANWFSLITIPIAKLLNKKVIVEMVLSGADDPLKLSKRGRHAEQQIFPHRPLKYSFFLMADAYVSKSHVLSEAYLQSGLPEVDLFRVPSGVDVEKFQPPAPQEKQSLRRKLGLAQDQIVILFVGILNERKGVHHLLAAFREIVPDYPGALLLIVGPSRPSDAAYLHDIRRDIVDFELSTRVSLVDRRVDNVDEYMKAADIFALPTRREGLSVAILEAMATGLPIVTSDIPEIALSQIEHGCEGLLVPPQNPGELAQTLSLLIAQPELRTSLGQAARRKVLREFTNSVVLQQYLNLYKALMEHEVG